MSESIKNVSLALLDAQKAIKSVAKDATNPFFKSKYAQLPAVIDEIKGPCNKAGLVVLQPIMGDVLQTVILHSATGEWMASETQIICAKPNDPQAQGSAISYARRYGLLSMFLIPTEDDDAEGATQRNAITATQTDSQDVIIRVSTSAENAGRKYRWDVPNKKFLGWVNEEK